MKTLEIRRHSLTKKGEAKGSGTSLSQAGVELARAVGGEMPRFDRVVTSAIPRTAETAIAMGFAVDAIIPELCPGDPEFYSEVGHHERWSWDVPFQRFADLVAGGGPTARLSALQLGIWRDLLTAIPTAGHALVISHGRVIESGLVALIPDGDFAA